ncbi:MAG TPA: Zn-dependent hydrolase [Rhodospirillales bacterium]
MGNTVDARIDGDRLWRDLMAMAKIGATPGGGSRRIALTEADKQGRDLFVSWARAAGLQVRVDAIGNIFARRPGTDAKAPPVLAGSHLDTQPLGGRFDGVYGVLAALEVLRALDDHSVKTRAPLDAVVWTDEEGCRFAAGMVASGVFAGKVKLDDALRTADPDGVTMGQALATIGYAGPEPVGGYPVAAYFEAHIEQGPILEAEGRTIGVVLGAQSRRYFRVAVAGEEGHAGTLPMERRKDALLGAARMVAALNDVAFRFEPRPVITVGDLRVRPNSRNTVPGGCVFIIDSRHPDDAMLDRIEAAMRRACEEIASASGLGIAIEELSRSPASRFDERCVATVRQAAARLGHPHRDMHSGAGHDACNLAFKAPTGMIFVPCERGVSHNETENAKPRDLAAGADVLLQAMVEWAG